MHGQYILHSFEYQCCTFSDWLLVSEDRSSLDNELQLNMNILLKNHLWGRKDRGTLRKDIPLVLNLPLV